MSTTPNPTVPGVPSPTVQVPEEKRSFLASYLSALLWGIIAALICGIIWGVVCYFTNTNYFWLAIVIGFIVSIAASSAFKKLNFGIALLLLIPCLVLTVASVALGDFLYYTLGWAKEAQLPIMQSAREVAEAFIEVETSKEGAPSLLLGALGAIFGFFRAVRS